MKPIEKDLMIGMVSILNQAIEANQCGTPIMSDEHFNMRLADLKEFEDETGVMFANSPNCKSNIQSIIEIKEIVKDNLKECQDVIEIVEYSNQEDMMVYLDIDGSDMTVTYVDGYLTKIKSNDVKIREQINLINLPYKIKKEDTYTIKGKTDLINKPAFYVYDILEGGSNNFRDDLNEAKELNFDIVPFWFANNLNPKKLQGAIDYAFDCAVEDGLDCRGIVFKFSEKKFNNILNFIGCYYKH